MGDVTPRDRGCFSTLCGFLAVRREWDAQNGGGLWMFQYPLRVLGCEKRRPRTYSVRRGTGFSTLCGFLAVRRRERQSIDNPNDLFQYPLRVLGCEKMRVPAPPVSSIPFQYPLRVLGCEKIEIYSRRVLCIRGFSTLCGFLAVRRARLQ